MIEITDEIIAKFETILHDHVGYAASRNTDRILADLVKQAEITERPSSSIPVTIKFRVVATEEGQLNLVLNDVKWKVLSQSTDDDFYTTGIDPKQPNLPGFDQADPQPKPVVDVKALPEHAEDQDAGYDLIDHCGLSREDYSLLLDWNLHAAYKLFYSTMEDAKLYMTLDRNVEVMLTPYTWEVKPVPNIKEAMEAIDADQNAVLVDDIGFSLESRDKLVRWGFGVMILKWFPVLQKWQIDEWKGSDDEKWKKKIEFAVEEKDKMMEWIKSVLADDDVVLHQREFYKEVK